MSPVVPTCFAIFLHTALHTAQCFDLELSSREAGVPTVKRLQEKYLISRFENGYQGSVCACRICEGYRPF